MWRKNKEFYRAGPDDNRGLPSSKERERSEEKMQDGEQGQRREGKVEGEGKKGNEKDRKEKEGKERMAREKEE